MPQNRHQFRRSMLNRSSNFSIRRSLIVTAVITAPMMATAQASIQNIVAAPSAVCVSVSTNELAAAVDVVMAAYSLYLFAGLLVSLVVFYGLILPWLDRRAVASEIAWRESIRVALSKGVS